MTVDPQIEDQPSLFWALVGLVRARGRAVAAIVLGLALGLVLLWMISRGVPLGRVWSTIRQVHLPWVLLCILTVALTTAVKVIRWRGLFPPPRLSSVASLARSLLIGKMVNALLPVRLGDVVRIYLSGWAGDWSRAMVLGTVAAEKAFDTLFLLVFCGLAAIWAPLPSWLNVSLVVVTAGGLLILLLGLSWPEQRIEAWTDRWTERLPWGIGPRVRGMVHKGLSGLVALREPGMALRACGWSALVWTLAAGTNRVLFWAFDLHLSFGAGMLLLVLLHAGAAPPSSVGRLGVFHAIALYGLDLYGIDRAVALAYAVLLHAVVYGFEVLPGAVLVGLDVLGGCKGARLDLGDRAGL